MSRKADDDLWPMVMVPKREWDALVRFFRREEKVMCVMRGAFWIPGKQDDWVKEYEKDHPHDFKVYEAARLAASRKFGGKKKGERANG